MSASEAKLLRISECPKVDFQSVTGLRIRATDEPASPIVDEFYRDYDQAFVLANEKEELAGFRECLALNHGDAYAALEQRYGVFREIVAIAIDPGSNRRVAGANLIAFPARPKEEGRGPLLSINLNYVFVVPDARRQGHLQRMKQAVCEIAAGWFSTLDGPPLPCPATAPALVFIEQNDPLVISAADADTDTRHSGIDQFDRIRIWTRLGARIIDFPYVQPPLSAQQAIDDGLLFSVYGTLPERLSACDLKHHLDRFFGISVLKGQDPMQQPAAAAQLGTLARACEEGRSYALLDPSDALDRAQQQHSENSSSPCSLRGFLATNR
jgi:hypothetical protein